MYNRIRRSLKKSIEYNMKQFPDGNKCNYRVNAYHDRYFVTITFILLNGVRPSYRFDIYKTDIDIDVARIIYRHIKILFKAVSFIHSSEQLKGEDNG